VFIITHLEVEVETAATRDSQRNSETAVGAGAVGAGTGLGVLIDRALTPDHTAQWASETAMLVGGLGYVETMAVLWVADSVGNSNQ
jgi:hypothetical protein